MVYNITLDSKWKAIAKDKDGKIFVYSSMPTAKKENWGIDGSYTLVSDIVDASIFEDIWWKRSLLIRDKNSTEEWVPYYPEEWQMTLTLEEINELPLEAQVVSLKDIVRKYNGRMEGG